MVHRGSGRLAQALGAKVKVQEKSWWLDETGLPERLLWARLSVFQNGAAQVFDLDGRYHNFHTRKDAVLWLLEDEYRLLSSLVEEGELSPSEAAHVPNAPNDADLLKLMQRRLSPANQAAVGSPHGA